MNCEKCGAPIPEGAVFCVQCGAKVDNTGTSDAAVSSNDAPVYAQKESIPAGHVLGKKINLTYVIAAAVAVLVLVLAVAVFLKVKKTRVDLNEYLEMESTGYDGKVRDGYFQTHIPLR